MTCRFVCLAVLLFGVVFKFVVLLMVWIVFDLFIRFVLFVCCLFAICLFYLCIGVYCGWIVLFVYAGDLVFCCFVILVSCLSDCYLVVLLVGF